MKEVKDIYDLLGYINFDYIENDEVINKLFNDYRFLFRELGISKEVNEAGIILKANVGSLGYLLQSFYTNNHKAVFKREEHQSFGKCMKHNFGCDLTGYRVKDLDKIMEACSYYGIFLEKFKEGRGIGLRRSGTN